MSSLVPVTECKSADDVRALRRKYGNWLKPQVPVVRFRKVSPSQAKVIPVADVRVSNQEFPVAAAADWVFPLWKQIIVDACEGYEVSKAEFVSSSRKSRAVGARRLVAYRLRRELRWSLPKIARRMGGRDHTTILHHIRRYAEMHGVPVPSVQ
jgi:hypothetical protein